MVLSFTLAHIVTPLLVNSNNAGSCVFGLRQVYRFGPRQPRGLQINLANRISSLDSDLLGQSLEPSLLSELPIHRGVATRREFDISITIVNVMFMDSGHVIIYELHGTKSSVSHNPQPSAHHVS